MISFLASFVVARPAIRRHADHAPLPFRSTEDTGSGITTPALWT